MRDDLQELVDEVSRLLAAPATLEDAEFTLLAFCAHDDSRAETMDAVRTRSILTRGSPAATRAWFEEFGIAAAEGPLRTPGRRGRRHPDPAGHPRPARRAHPRLPVAARRRPDRPGRRRRPGPRRRRRPRRRGRPAARRARRGRRGPRPARSPPPSPAAPPPRRRRSAPSPRSSASDAAQVLVALAPGPAGLPAGWRLPAAGAIATALDDGRDGAGSPCSCRWPRRPTCARPARWPPPSLADLPPRQRGRGVRRPPRGRRAAGAVGAGPRGGAGGGRRAAALPRGALGRARRLAAGQRAPRARSRRRPAAGRPACSPRRRRSSSTAPGSASRAAAALQIHRQTLYYRLARIARAHRPRPGRRRGPAAAAHLAEGRPARAPRLSGDGRRPAPAAHRDGGRARGRGAHPRPAGPRPGPRPAGRRPDPHARLLAGGRGRARRLGRPAPRRRRAPSLVRAPPRRACSPRTSPRSALAPPPPSPALPPVRRHRRRPWAGCTCSRARRWAARSSTAISPACPALAGVAAARLLALRRPRPAPCGTRSGAPPATGWPAAGTPRRDARGRHEHLPRPRGVVPPGRTPPAD